MQLPRTARRCGFTMIEALVVITIIGIAVLVMMPAIGRGIAKTRVQRASAAMASDLRTAFAISAQQRRPVRIMIDQAGRVLRIRSRAGDTTYLETRYDGSSDLVVRELTAVPASLVVFPGGLAAGGITVTMQTTPANRRQVTANRAGQVRITQP